jgi:outer membrane protein assembly factor BamB
MAVHGKRQRAGRILVWFIVGLVLAFGGFLAFQFFYGARFVSDAEALSRLEKAPLSVAPTDPDLVGQWPQWRGPNRDGVSQETGWSADWPAKGPRVLWKKPIGPGYSAVAVKDGRLYTMMREGDNEVVLCWKADTGKQVWRFPYPARYSEGGRTFYQNQGNGPRSTPTVDGDLVFTVGAAGMLHCRKARTGKRVWDKDLFAEFHARQLLWGISFSPLVKDGRVYISPGGDDGNSLAALDRRTGNLVWNNLDDKPAYSSPIALTVDGIEQIIFFTGSGLVSVAPDSGKPYWRYQWETSYDANIATPIVAGNYLFISSGYGHGCAAIEVCKDGNGGLQGKQVYKGNHMKNHFSSSVFYKDHVYGFDEQQLRCLDFRTGKIVWKERGYQKGSLLVADGWLIVLGEYGKLAVARASPKGFRVKSSFQASRVKCWTVPVLAGGKLYVRDETHLTCYDLKKP